MNPVRKRPAYLFAKDFQIENVLGNLQGYKIATGQLDKSDIDEVSKKYGADESLVFGSLITKAGETSKSGPGKRELNEDKDDIETKQKRRKRRRRKRKQKLTNSENEISTLNLDCAVALSEPLSIPSSILAYGSSDDEADVSDHSNQDDKVSASEESKSSDEETSNDFFGLTDKDDDEIVATETEITVNDPTEVNDRLNYFASCSHPYPEVRTDMDEWDDEKHKFKENSCSLSTYKCWKCKRVGHLAEDCTVKNVHSPGTQHFTKNLYQDEEDQVSPSVLKDYFRRCHSLRNSKNSKCSECSAGSNLAFCLDCGLVFCDGRSHLTNHMMTFPSHNKLYSFKLRRLIKCCKSTCRVVDASKLLMCSTCLSKQFNSHYNMINATWSRSGLQGIPNTLACEQHFQWHRINCANTMEEPLISQQKLELTKQHHDGLLNEFYF